MIISDWLVASKKILDDAGIESSRLDCLIMLEEVTGQDRAWILTRDGDELQEHEKNQLEDMLEKRKKRIPLAYITGVKEFYNVELFVDESVLIPRPETELLVEYAEAKAPADGSILELGTGSGAIAIALKDARKDLIITATDVSQLALTVAERNAMQNHVEITFIESDMFENIEKEYSLILANLPYVPSGDECQPEITHEPELALFSGTDGLNHYRSFFAEAKDYLEPTGSLVIEFDPSQIAEIKKIAGSCGYFMETVSDYIYRFNRQIEA